MKSILRMFGIKDIRFSSHGHMPGEKEEIRYDYTQKVWELHIMIPLGRKRHN